MNRAQVGKVLSEKIDDWVKSIDDYSLRHLVRKNAIVSGGSIASLLRGEKPHDYDIYFRTEECVRKVIAYYLEKADLSKRDRDRILDGLPTYYDLKTQKRKFGPYDVKFITTNALTLMDDVQLVLCSHGEPRDVSSRFDFLHCQGTYDSFSGKVSLSESILEAILNKELVYTGSDYPVASLIRTRKFIRRGWKINAGQYLKMAVDINRLDFDDPDTLKNQLIGVDVVYFDRILNEDDPNELSVDAIVNRIDEMFDGIPVEMTWCSRKGDEESSKGFNQSRIHDDERVIDFDNIPF